eukprot:gnl/Chilomastix_cuspidata/294.p1 GENE.gnl/Chilomastix_cuspidata/294~~gnl/Chilomastix_cuspidata/294.p1  ORF type:complete len:944 (+),score=412.41 gnl/Chilomastix_cuspidata/294:35-2866(+)
MSKYFRGAHGQDEMNEILEELRTSDPKKQREAVKRVIAFMTVGKDVSAVFTDVLKCIQTTDLELKKLVYLYLINYSRTNPDATILAVNTFDNDSKDKDNPLIRALAIRTMACIRVEQITEYISEPLRRCLHDQDPYVRKTASLAVAKLFDIDPELCIDQGFLDDLRELLTDGNQMVVSNTVAAFTDIIARGGKQDLFRINREIVNSLLNAINEANEWGQSFILDALINYTPTDSEDAEVCAERIAPRLQHANPSVALSAVRAIVHFLEFFEANPNPVPFAQTSESVRVYLRKIVPPLVTLLSSEPEIQYIGLRSIPLILQRYPGLFERHIKVFFPRYSDAIYVKMEKLDILIQIANDDNAAQILRELEENVREIDPNFSRKAVRSIGHIAVKLDSAADMCVEALVKLIKSKIDHVVQESIICIRDIFRKYPNTYESVITTLCENLDTLDEPEAKTALVWIIGEYADRIENATDILSWFAESFIDDPAEVQLGLLTAAVRLFLVNSNSETQALVQSLLETATKNIDSPDIRDRAFLYWRLLSKGIDFAKGVACAAKPPISSESFQIDPELQSELMPQLGTLAAVLMEKPATLMAHLRSSLEKRALGEYEEDEDAPEVEPAPVAPAAAGGDLLGLQLPATETPGAPDAASDLLSLMGLSGAPSGAPAAENPAASLMGVSMPSLSTPPVSENLPDAPFIKVPVRPAGIEVSSSWGFRGGRRPHLLLRLKNLTSTPINTFQIRFQNNGFGLAPLQPSVPLASPLGAGSSAEVAIPVGQNASAQPQPSLVGKKIIQVGLRDPATGSLYVLLVPAMLHVFFNKNVQVVSNPAMFSGAWEAAVNGQVVVNMPSPPPASALPINPPSVLRKVTRGGFVSVGQQTAGPITTMNFATGLNIPGLNDAATVMVQIMIRAATPYPLLRFAIRVSPPAGAAAPLIDNVVKFLLMSK